MQETTVGDVPVRALRVTYVGELGWELYCPAEYGAGLWRTLVDAGEPHGLRAGRLPGDREPAAGEGLPGLGRGRHPGHDAGRGGPGVRGASWRRLRGSRGAGGDQARRAAARPRRLRCLMLADPRAVALGGEPVRGGDAVDGSGRHLRRLRLHRRPLDRLRPAARGDRRRHARCRCRSTGSGSTPRWSAARCTTRRATASAPDPARPPPRGRARVGTIGPRMSRWGRPACPDAHSRAISYRLARHPPVAARHPPVAGRRVPV